MPESLTIDAAQAESDDAYPVSVTVRQLPKPAEEVLAANGNGHKVPNGLYRSNLAADPNAALLQSAQDAAGTKTETIRAKYVVGCDGAHSWTRRQIGSVMEGEQTDYVWGVLDCSYISVLDFLFQLSRVVLPPCLPGGSRDNAPDYPNRAAMTDMLARRSDYRLP